MGDIILSGGGSSSSGGGGPIEDGANPTIEATVLDLTNSNPLAVAIVDGNGDQIVSFGGGTQYAEDTPSTAGEIVTMAGVVRNDVRGSLVTNDGDRTELQVNSSGDLRVDGSAVTQPVSGAISFTAPQHVIVDSGSITVGNAAGASAVNIQDGGNSITVDGPLTDAQLRAVPVPVSGTVAVSAVGGTVAVTQSTSPWVVSEAGTDVIGAGTLAALNAAVTLVTPGKASVYVSLTGSPVACAITFESLKADGVTWEGCALRTYENNSGLGGAQNAAILASATGSFPSWWTGPINGTSFRARVSTYGSGTINVSIVAKPFDGQTHGTWIIGPRTVAAEVDANGRLMVSTVPNDNLPPIMSNSGDGVNPLSGIFDPVAAARLMIYNGASYDRLRGDVTNGAFVQMKAGNLTQVGGATLTEGQKTMAASIPVTLASDQTSIPFTPTLTGESNLTLDVLMQVLTELKAIHLQLAMMGGTSYVESTALYDVDLITN